MDKLALVDIGTKFGSPFGTGKGTFGSLITLILSALIAVSATIALFLFLQGGLQIITAAGSNDPKRHSQGTRTMTYAIIGFIIVLGAYWVIQLIERIIGASLTTFSF